MSDYDRDDRLEELLRASLNEEAETVVPRGDGLSNIQGDIAARRARWRYLRPTLALGSAVVVAAAALGVYVATNDSNDTDKVSVGDPTGTPTSEPTTSTPTPTSEPVAVEKFPSRAIFPFTSAGAEVEWEKSYADGHQPWVADPTAVSQSWVQNYLGFNDVDQTVSKTLAADGESADVVLGRTMTAEAKRTVAVTSVHLLKYGKAWIVVRATDPADAPSQLAITSPTPGTEVRTPLAVAGPAYGVDESVTVDVRDAATPTSYGKASTGFGNGLQQWEVGVPFSEPTGPDGVLVASEASQADGGTQRITAIAVQFGEASGTPQQPRYFYAVKNDRITKFAASSGAAIDYLTTAQPGGGVSDPQLVQGSVYFLRGGGTCANSLMAVDASGADKTEQPAASPDAGYVISSYAVDASATRITYFETACDTSRDPQAKLVTLAQDNEAPPAIKFTSIPPGIQGDPAFLDTTPDVAAFVRTGTQGYLARYRLSRDNYDTTSTPSRNACPGWDVNNGLPVGLDVDGAGALWFAADAGSTTKIVRCTGDGATVEATVPTGKPSDLDVYGNGTAVLVADAGGNVWRWDGSGTPTELSPSVPLDHVTW